jgi:hypothetical protein
MAQFSERPDISPAGPPIPDRRRAGWGEFRHAYPGILATMSIALVLLVAISAWLVYKRVNYQREVDRLRSGMTEAERKKTDMLVSSTQNRFQVMVELIRRQALGDKELHLAVTVDSSVMRLQREGALLRDMHVSVGPEKVVGTAPDTVHMAIPRGTRTVEKIIDANDGWEVPRWVYEDRGLAVPDDRTVKGALGPVAIVLNGGTVLYAMPSAGPLNDSSYVLPGSVRLKAADLRAIRPNLQVGMRVYFY